MKTRFIIAFVALLSALAIKVTAQSNRGLQDETQRIHQGVQSGQLTHREAARLNAQKAQLRNEALRYKANDGKIGPRERADQKRDNRSGEKKEILQDQRQASRKTYRKKHNNRDQN